MYGKRRRIDVVLFSAARDSQKRAAGKELGRHETEGKQEEVLKEKPRGSEKGRREKRLGASSLYWYSVQ